MSAASDEIAMLDATLALDGEDVTLQRVDLVGGAQVVGASVECRAFIRQRGAGQRQQDLIGNVKQGDITIIMSPTEITAAGWTSGRVAGDDQMVPKTGNRIIRAGRAHTIEGAFGIRVQGELVRIEAIARG